MQWYSPKQIAKQRNLSPATIAGLIEDGELEAVNVARRGSVRKCWRSSDSMLSAFDERRCNSKPSPRETKRARRTIQRPTKDFFETAGVTKR